MTGRLLPRSFFARSALHVAPELIGATITTGVDGRPVTVRLTEVEAYLGPLDPASHAFRRTPRSEVMYGPPGHLYVYFVYGMHWCANVVTSPDGQASAVLMRAGEVIAGLPAARQRRPAARSDAALARGPASLATVLGIRGDASGADLCRPGRPAALRVGTPPDAVATGPRVGVAAAAEQPWRFFDPGSASVSSYRRGGRAGRRTRR